MKKLGTDARLKKKLQEVLDLTTAENAAMDNANNPSASNPFATMADVENVELGEDIVDALAGAGDPSSSNPFATISDITDLGLDSDELAAIEAANSPSAENPFATLADLPEGGGITDVTYDELLALMDSSGDGLVPGQFYRITDFATVHYMVDNVTATEDINIGSTEPLIVLAISESALDSRAYSELYPYDVIHYDWNPANWLTDISFGGNDETLVTGFKGVIYFRHDTLHDNYMGYDFRNVKFRRWNNGFEVGSVWLSEYQGYTSTADGVTDPEDYIDVLTFNCPGGEEQYNNEVRGVHIESFKDQKDISYYTNSILCNNVFYLEADYGWYQVFTNTIGSLSCFNTFNGYIEANIIGNEFYSNIIGNRFYNNTIGDYFYNNTIGDYFYNNTIGDYFYNNIIGNNFHFNTIGNNFHSNTIENNFYNNTIGNNIYSNTIGNDFRSNTIGNDFRSNTIGNDFRSNTIGNDFRSNTIGNNIYSNTIGNDFRSNTIGDSCQSITAENIVTHITIADSCTNIRIGNSSSYIELGDSSGGVINIDIGQGCGGEGQGIVIGGLSFAIKIEDACHTLEFGEGVSDVRLEADCFDIILAGVSGVICESYCHNITINDGGGVYFNTNCSDIVIGYGSWANIFGVQCSKLILPENSINNIFVNYVRLPGGATKDFTDSLVNQITDGSQVTHRMCGTKIVGTYLEEQSDGSFVEVHAEDIIGVSV
jgi:hypothetical protein